MTSYALDMHERSPESADQVADKARTDGLASVAIMVLTVALILFLISRIV